MKMKWTRWGKGKFKTLILERRLEGASRLEKIYFEITNLEINEIWRSIKSIDRKLGPLSRCFS